ncbi:ceramide synthase 2a [Rhincodon typus]|uniref:ceramide synthase 2a n=1 Tax=Rhincodon typus TaxID=259920 RepID=UPI00202F9E7E|nr:ceramide synthase 2a [Rhincodon typus]
MFQTIYDWFWWDRLWLPYNLTWTDLEDRDGRIYAKASDLYVTIPCAFAFMIIRYLFERSVATYFARVLGIKEKVRLRVKPNPILEKSFRASSKHPRQSDIEGLSKKCGLSPRQVERWFRRRRNLERPSVLKKFREACWRFTFYVLAFTAGLAVIVDKPWFYDLRETWKGFPIQTMLPSQYWYYMIELGFYWSLLFSVAFDVKRKDFREQIIHHVATIILISFSWCTNYVRAGTLVMAVHDASDYFLEVTAGGVCRIIHCTVIYPLELYPAFFGYYFFNAILVVLQLLHIFWAALILRMTLKFMTGNQIVEDERSDRDETDNSEDEDDEEPVKNGLISNGHSTLNNNHTKSE